MRKVLLCALVIVALATAAHAVVYTAPVVKDPLPKSGPCDTDTCRMVGVVMVNVLPDGRARIMSSCAFLPTDEPLVAEQAKQIAARQWEPGTINGEPIDAIVQLKVYKDTR